MLRESHSTDGNEKYDAQYFYVGANEYYTAVCRYENSKFRKIK